MLIQGEPGGEDRRVTALCPPRPKGEAVWSGEDNTGCHPAAHTQQWHTISDHASIIAKACYGVVSAVLHAR